MSGPVFTPAAVQATPGVAARLARQTLEADLKSLPDLRARLSGVALDRLESYVALLLEANQHLNLTRLTDPAAIARQHLLDALVALPELDGLPSTSAVDIGSGGGVPAIPMAIARPDLSWLLIESIGKKARALESFVEELGLTNVAVVADRAEVVARDRRYRERAGLVTARAVAALPVLVELGMPLLVTGGVLLAWKGPLTPGDEELERGARAAREVGGGTPELLAPAVSQLGGHTLVRVCKERETPALYPRKPGEPGRRPLG